MEELLKRFILEINESESNINHICDDYEIKITEKNRASVRELIEMDDDEERKKDNLMRFKMILNGESWWINRVERNHYITVKLLGKDAEKYYHERSKKNKYENIHCPNCGSMMQYEPSSTRNVLTLNGRAEWKFPATFTCKKCRLSASAELVNKKFKNHITLDEIRCPRCKGHGKITVGEVLKD